MTSPVHGPQSAATSLSPNTRKKHSPILWALIGVLAVFVVIISIIIASRLAAQNPDNSAAKQDMATSADAQSTVSTSGTPTPSQTDVQVLDIIRAEVKRDASDGQARGRVDAPVVMVLYSDFSCPYCTLFAQKVEPGLQDLIDDGTLRIEWRDLAQISKTSPLAAQAGRAAAEQGKFWEFHNAAYSAASPTDHPEYTETLLIEYAAQAGVEDLDKFRATMNAPETAQAVADAKAHAYSIGITGTPFLIINDAVIGGYKELPDVRATIEEQAQHATS